MRDAAVALRYFHGGPRGLKMILPPVKTGAPSCSSYGAHLVHRRDRVYFTVEQEAALLCAALHPSGAGTVYEVEPIGIIEADPDGLQPDHSFQAEAARVVREIRPPGKVLKRIRRVVMGT